MMKFVSEVTRPYGIKTIVSMNTIMVDGTGMCGGCRLTVGGETKFACVDGPDFDGHLVDFDSAMRRGAMYKAQELSLIHISRISGSSPNNSLISASVLTPIARMNEVIGILRFLSIRT